MFMCVTEEKTFFKHFDSDVPDCNLDLLINLVYARNMDSETLDGSGMGSPTGVGSKIETRTNFALIFDDGASVRLFLFR